MGGDLWPMLLIPAFLGGSLAAFFVCTGVAIIMRQIRGRNRVLGVLLVVQGVGCALVACGLISARNPGSMASMADGIGLYPFIFGIAAIVGAPLAIWEMIRR
jgi:hypothetical protein